MRSLPGPDPTAGQVIGRDLGRQVDDQLGQLTPFHVAMLFDSSAGLTVRQIARKHRVPEHAVRHALDVRQRIDLGTRLRTTGITTADASDTCSTLVHQLDKLSRPSCQNCGTLLRQALEPRRRGRPARYCVQCRAFRSRIAAKPFWQTGYVGTCNNYRFRCRCPGRDTIAAEDDLVLLWCVPERERWLILLFGRVAGDIGYGGGSVHHHRGRGSGSAAPRRGDSGSGPHGTGVGP